MIDKRLIAEPTTHYGSAKAATRHFITQRVTGALNVLFLIFFVWLALRLAGAERTEMVAVIANPLVAAVLALLIVNVCAHMRIGMREVIEDYLDDERTNRLARFVNDVFSGGVALVALVSIVKIAFWG
ncbi:MAG: succinate dehydrogenase, hydrophobic membrane anchor protein [Devosia sp.]|nr:succinate dehydrogenase, hydrophobic membrane anchor protein [Devosia sp.]